ncbi:thioredoxin family protein [Clostridium cochlearium]|jgi:thiol-disulfide isomerase/thioredoxin|uniref:Thioredoxin n=1 Tax=Clostridium cochlearium TaxID=1494 RepID=A0A239ZMP1_CLOCO|nr:thioredoxin family protein [Clostridium cochlearium]MBE6064038.1 thioredoxin family protein [Clostridium cochlearium]MBU5269690.1 thioredoxin family protein [Clostridium cochlearium]MCG4571204.1 thioredoxin family protein [Clostridium cochlearium]MCG4578733.1 thioredoxin family protein [Clostridium cochlearium]MCR1971321.1 thioredoxin family protein [Clostridium cochlearium]
MKNLKNIEEMESVINKNEMALIYIWGNSCNVCHALKAKIEEVIKEYPNIQCYDVELDKVKEIQSRFSVFTVPIILFYIKERETLRESRYVNIKEFKNNIDRYYKLYYF